MKFAMTTNLHRRHFLLTLLAASTTLAACASGKEFKLLNVSYDPTRELFVEFNAAFARHWKETTGDTVTIQQSHGGSSKQARSVIDGLPADVVTLALAYDVEAIAAQAKLLPADWQKRLPNNSSPYTSTISFLVRKGNPKGIKDWDDLVRPGVSIITPNPKTSGSARWNYLGAYGFEFLRTGRDEARARDFIKRLYQNVPMLDSGARGATTTFVERGIGDVLINWENEILLAAKELGTDKFDLVVPSTSILCEPAVSLVDKNAKRKGTEAVAKAYLEYLYSTTGQEIAAKHYFRPQNKEVLAKYATQFPDVKLFTLAEIVGDWQKAQNTHFNDGGIFDQISRGNR